MSGRAYPPEIREQGIALVQGGLGPTAAAFELQRRMGVTVRPRTVARWADAERAERKRRDDRLRRRVLYVDRHDGRLGYRQASPVVKVKRLRALVALGVPFEHVATVLNFDWSEDKPLDAATVRRLITRSTAS